MKTPEELFKKADNEIHKRDISAFVNALIELHENLTCDCFLKNINSCIYEAQLSIIEEFEENTLDFNFCLAKGYLMQRIQKEKLAYFYLSKAIELNKECDLPYSLRALIKAKINTEIQYDASKAVSLNPNARNYFILAKVMDYLNSNDFDDIGFFSHESSTDYLNKAIRLRPDFSCAYYERAFHYHFIGDGINDFLRCIETDPKHKPYYPLSMVLITMNENKKALNFSLNGLTIRGDNIHFHNLFACANNIIGNYEEVLNQYKKINDILLKNGEPKLNSKRFLNDFINLKFFYAFKFYSNMEFNKAEKLFAESIEEWHNTGVGSPHDIDKEGPYRKYLISHLKSINSKISINENNPIFLKFEGLIKSYNEKFPNHSIMSKSELNINNLMIYRTTSKIGFGKYEYEKISEIIEKDPNYILWCIVNLEHFALYVEDLWNTTLRYQPNYNLAIEYNLIKELFIEKWLQEKIDEENRRFNRWRNYEQFTNEDAFDDPQQYRDFLASR